MKKIYWFSILLLLLNIKSQATDYYVKAAGNDQLNGTSVTNAWRTLDNVNNMNFAPGDRILLEGGSVFNGFIYLDAGDLGDPSKPISITSYGTGKATVNSGNQVGLYIFNTAGVKVTNLFFKGAGATVNQENGIKVFNNIPDKKLEYIYIDNVEVAGFSKAGVFISGGAYNAGFRNVTITNSKIHDNGETGIGTFGDSLNLTKVFAHQNIYVASNKVYNTTGQASLIWFHTGSGIALSSVDGATAEYNEVYNNGFNNRSPDGGPVGIWAFNANNVAIQYNESHHNKAGFDRDGGGFDLDGGTTNSYLQYNYSHDNDGSGYLVSQFKKAQPFKNNVIRYNISQDDGRKNGYSSILVWSSGSNGGVQDLQIYNNTVYLTPAASGNPKAVWIDGPMTGVLFKNNIIYTTSWVYSIVSTINSGVSFQGNCYYSSGTFNIWWNGVTYPSLDAWSKATGQEITGGVLIGMQTNPMLNAPGTSGTISNLANLKNLTAYKLQSTSPLIGKATSVSLSGLKTSLQDYYGYILPQGPANDIGAHEFANASTGSSPYSSLTSPAVNSTFKKSASLVLRAFASSGDASVSKVEFYNGTTLLGSTTAWPYKYTWSSMPAGTYILTSKTYNTGGLVAVSVPVTITVADYYLAALRIPENPTSSVNGLNYSYYEGVWSVLPNFTGLTPVKTGVVTNFTLSVKNSTDNFGLTFDGFVNVPTDGIYTFYTTSNDGSKLFIGATQVVSNDGVHTAAQKSGTIGLKAGKHSIRVQYFDYTDLEALSVYFSGPGITKQLIPNSSLYRNAALACSASGSVLREVWNGIPGDDMQSLTTSINYPGNPSFRESRQLFEGPVLAGDNYGARYRGYFCAPETGNYTFWISSDNNSELYVGTSESPASKVKVAFVEGYTDSREWLKFPTQKSVPIYLIKGSSYYVEVLHKEGSGGDNLAVGWQLPSGNLERPVPGMRLSPYNLSSGNRDDLDASNNQSLIPMSVFPNPGRDKIWIDAGLTEETSADVKIVNELGVTQSSVAVTTLENKITEMDISNLERGIYIIHIKGSEKPGVKFIKE